MPNEFVARNGIISRNNVIVTGSLTVTQGITGSLYGTASYVENIPSLQQVTNTGYTTTNPITSAGFSSTEISNITYFDDVEEDGLLLDNTNAGSDSTVSLGLGASTEYLGGLKAIPSTYAASAKRRLVSLVSYGQNRIGIIANYDSSGTAQDIFFSNYGTYITPQLQIKGSTSNILVNTNLDTGEKFQVSGSGKFLGTLNVTGSANIKGDVSVSGSIQFIQVDPLTTAGTGIFGASGGWYFPQDRFNNTYAGNSLGGYYGDFAGGFTFRNGSAAQLMRVHQNGRVAISSTVSSPSATLQISGEGTTSATTSLLVQDSSTNSSLEVLDNNVVKIGRVSSYAPSENTLIVGHKTSNQYLTTIAVDPNKDDSTYYKVILEARYYSGQPFQLYSSGIQTWLYGYASGMFAQPHAMKIPTQISMGTMDIVKSEISGSVLFIHGENFYAQAAYTRYTSYSTGVDTLRGAVSGLWTGNKFRVWNYENTSIDLGVNNVQRLQVTPSGINVTGSIVATGNLTLGQYGKIASGDFANPAGNNSIAMGYGNTAIGNASMVVGFISDTDSGAEYTAAIGYEARSYLPGQISFAYGNHTFNNRDAGAQQSFITVKNSSGLTTGATMDLSIAGTSVTLLGSSRAWMVTMDWIATVSSISGTATGVTVGDTAGGTIRAVVKKVGGITSVVGTIANDKAADGSLSTSAMAFAVGGSNNLIPRFTGPTFAGGGTVTMKVVGGIKLAETTV
jgi:hypothetical protein